MTLDQLAMMIEHDTYLTTSLNIVHPHAHIQIVTLRNVVIEFIHNHGAQAHLDVQLEQPIKVDLHLVLGAQIVDDGEG